VNRRGVPDDGVFGAEIAMGEDVAEAGNRSPRYFRELPCDFLWQVFDSFPDDFQVADHCINRAAVVDERVVFETLNVGIDGKGGF